MNLTPRTIEIMKALEKEREGLRAADVAEVCDIDQKSIYVVLSRMVALEFIEREGPRALYRLTPAGRKMLAAARSFEKQRRTHR